MAKDIKIDMEHINNICKELEGRLMGITKASDDFAAEVKRSVVRLEEASRGLKGIKMDKERLDRIINDLYRKWDALQSKMEEE